MSVINWCGEPLLQLAPPEKNAPQFSSQRDENSKSSKSNASHWSNAFCLIDLMLDGPLETKQRGALSAIKNTLENIAFDVKIGTNPLSAIDLPAQKNILIISDDKLQCSTLKKILDSVNLNCQSLSKMPKNPDLLNAMDIDLIIIDLKHCLTSSCIDSLNEIRAKKLLLSAEKIPSSLDLEVLVKPYQSRHLLNALSEILA